MTNSADELKKQNISAGSDISGNIHIRNIYQPPEDDIPLSSDEIENGLTRIAQHLPPHHNNEKRDALR